MAPKENCMRTKLLIETVNSLIGGEKGLLAMDESTGTCNKRFSLLSIPETEEAQRSYREMIVTAPGLAESISGAILYDETIRQKISNGDRFVEVLNRAGIIPGIKVDTGAKPMPAFPGEKITEGLDGLPVRAAEYVQLGARFAKWRAVITIGGGLPTQGCIDANAHALARYAIICQEAGLVPIIEPEVLMEGPHTLPQCMEVTSRVLHAVFDQLHIQRVILEGIILKPNMVLPGKECADQSNAQQIADSTVHCLLRAVPAAVAGIAFLSGGQSSELACTRLNAMNVNFQGKMPWSLTFSFARAIQQSALNIWAGDPCNVKAAQKELVYRARCSRSARRGEYTLSTDGRDARAVKPSA
jgi:fructose-bisphosphate aldolase class I